MIIYFERLLNEELDEVRSLTHSGATEAEWQERLERAAHRIKLLSHEVAEYYGSFRVSTDLIELRNLLQTAELIVMSALKRKESRGLHYILDYPQTDAEAKDTVLVP